MATDDNYIITVIMSKDNCREMQASISIKHDSDVVGGEQTKSINYNYHNKWFNSGENFLGEIKCKRTLGQLQQFLSLTSVV